MMGLGVPPIRSKQWKLHLYTDCTGADAPGEALLQSSMILPQLKSSDGRLESSCQHVSGSETDPKIRELLSATAKIAPSMAEHQLDQVSLDESNGRIVTVYVCGPPCQPFSLRGSRRLWSDPRSTLLKDSLQQVASAGFDVALIENAAEVMKLIADMDAELSHLRSRGYLVATLHLDPSKLHFVAKRKRTYIFMVKKSKSIYSDETALGKFLRDVFDKMAEVLIPDGPAADVDMVVENFSGVDHQRKSERAKCKRPLECNCFELPPVVCPLHPCKCRRCKSGSTQDCRWRSGHTQWAWRHKISEIQDMWPEVLQSIEKFKTPRVRNMLALQAMRSKSKSRPDFVCDVTQSISRCQFRNDGKVGAICTSSKVLSTSLSRLLTVAELACVMGFRHESALALEASCRQTLGVKLVGNSMHVPTIGACVISLLHSLK